MSLTHCERVSGAVACLPYTLLISLTCAGLAHAQAPRDLAFPGYSGFLNVPSATVLHRGQADVQWSDQAHLFGREGFEDGRYGHLNNISGTFGLMPFVEVGGRLVWDKTHTNCYTEGCSIRDLSANVKVQAPFIPQEWFTLAAGAQDLGGETGDFEAMYVVAGKQFGPVEITVGYGDTDYAPRYLDGGFGAISYRPLPWLSLITEYDGYDARAGIGLSSPQGWLPWDLQIKGKVLAWDDGDSDNDRHFASIGLSMPFGNARSKSRLPAGEAPAAHGGAAHRHHHNHNPAASPGQAAESSPYSQAIATGPAVMQSVSPGQVEEQASKQDAAVIAAQRIGQTLVNAGYDRVKTAGDGTTLRIQWENNLYNRDERDSIAEVARRVHYTGGGYERAELTLVNQGLPVATRTVMLNGEAAYAVSSGFARETLFDRPDTAWDFEGSYGPTWKPRLTLSPTMSTGIATEYGVWDASVALSAELDFSLWPGALVSVRHDTEIYETEDYERGGVFYGSRQRTGLVEAEIQQAFKLHPQLYTSFHAGRYAINYDGGFNETLLLSPGGRHAIGFLGGKFHHKDFNDDDRTQALAQYSYYNPQLDAQFTVYGGQFFAEDEGFRIDSRFWFGDYALTLQYKNTDAEFVSLGWVIPLTPVKDHQFRYLQVKGDADWNYAVQTRINEDKNIVSFGGAGVVRSSNPLQELYLNRGRIGD